MSTTAKTTMAESGDKPSSDNHGGHDKHGGKWMTDLRPEMPVSEAAKTTLRRRLEPVWKWSGEAAKAKKGSTKAVHQLRVAVRRAMSVMQGYAELLPHKKATKAAARLHKLRRRAGDARDLDVLIGRLKQHSEAARLQPLIEELAELRIDAQEPIVKLHRKLKKRDFEKSLRTLVDKVTAPKHEQETTFVAWARHALSRTVDTFFTAGSADMSDVNLLHHFRIEGKQLRYAMEYFSAAFGPELRSKLYPEIEQVQGLLGTVNDHASALAHFGDWRSRWDDPVLAKLLDELTAVEQAELAKATEAFFTWWTPDRAEALKKNFAALLQLPTEEHAA